MHESIFSGISSHRYTIFHRQNDKKLINSKSGFQNWKPDFGFKTENRISSFRLTSLVLGQNGMESRNDSRKNGIQTKWYWTKWHRQKDMDKMVLVKSSVNKIHSILSVPFCPVYHFVRTSLFIPFCLVTISDYLRSVFEHLAKMF